MPEHPKTIGERSEAHVLAALVEHFMAVLLPWGENCRYDFVVERDDGQLLRVQAKTGRLKDGAVRFHTRSFTYHHPKHGGNGKAEHCSRDYSGDVDMFAVYCVENGRVYLVPIDDLPKSVGCLRVEPTRNGQNARIRWAAQYELHRPE